MRLRLETLQAVVKQTLAEERAVDALREEVTRVLGPSVVTEGKLEHLAQEANYQLELLERTGRSLSETFKPSLMLKFANNKSADVRKLVARTIPSKFVSKLTADKDPAVRAIVAKRMPYSTVREMVRRFPGDDELRLIAKRKKLQESGLPKPKEQDGPFEMYHDERLGDAGRTNDTGLDLSEQYYESLANKLISDYGGNMEGQWEAPLAHRYCSSVKATSGVEIDEQKLYKEIMKQIEEKDDRTLERYALKECIAGLRESASRDEGSEAYMPVISEEIDPVEELVESNMSSSQYIDAATKLFCVKESTMPMSLRKYRVTEGLTGEQLVPCKATLPHKNGIRSIDERALDTFVKHWNTRQAMNGEPIKINWGPSPTYPGAVSFNVELK
jgi:hypothetical protein